MGREATHPARWLVAAATLWIAAGTAARASEADEAIGEGLGRLAQQDYPQAAELLADAVANHPDNPRATEAMIGAGQALRHLGRFREAMEFFEGALQREPSEERAVPILLALADCARRAGALVQAEEHLQRVRRLARRPSHRAAAQRLRIGVLQAGQRFEEAWTEFLEAVRLQEIGLEDLGELAVAIGSAALMKQEVAIALAAFDWYLQHAGPDAPRRQRAESGAAWAAAHGAQSPAQAARRLQRLVERYPESDDAPRSLLACAACAQRGGDLDLATAALEKLLAEYPDSPEITAALEHLARVDPQRLQSPGAIDASRRMLMAPGTPFAADAPLTPELITAALKRAAEDDDTALWEAAVARLVHPRRAAAEGRATPRQEDRSGEAPARRAAVEALLSHWDEAGQAAQSERLAAAVLDHLGHPGAAAASEAVCRWAAQGERWSLLALAAQSHAEQAAPDTLSPLVARLLAEGLIQNGRLDEATPLLDHLLEQHALADFDVLVRRAEIALAREGQEAAADFIDRLAQAVGNDTEQVLADMLQAELRVRQARLPDARALLERVVRSPAAAEAIKARAQWLIGETFYLQRQFPEAVDAYRQVESLDEDGTWTAASLLQAGKAFEQLGRKREAAVCYSALLSRFGDSQHTQAARQRLALLGEAAPRH